MTSYRTRRKRNIAVALAVVVALVAALGAFLGTRHPTTGKPPVDQFTAYVGQGNPSGVHQVSTLLGHEIGLASDALGQRDWSGITDDESVIDRWKNSGYRMIWSVPMLPESGGVSLAEGATGAYNTYFEQLARNLVAAGMGDSYLRLGWEFNQSRYPWYPAGQPANFVAYWRQIVTTMRGVPGADFSFVWNPSRGDNGPKDAAMGNFADYYPGDDYVDIVGMDIYDTAWNRYPGEPAEFHTMLTQTWGLDWLARFGAEHDKPLAIPELGLGPFGPSAGAGQPFTGSGNVGGGDDPAFISDMLQWISHHDVAFFSYWDFQESTIQNGANPQSLEALRQGLAGLGT
ncbi:MAG: glycosyl hydrolase [Acidimicrobiales bacterium]|jgi:hypothetical protein